MTKSLLTSVCAMGLALVFAPPVFAQTPIDTAVFTAGKAAEMVIASVAQAVLAVQLCGTGEMETWKRVIERADRRYKQCLGQDRKWSSLASEYQKEEDEVRVSGSPRAFASFAFDDFLRTRGAEAKTDVAAYCARAPWQMVLEPATATDAVKADFLRSHPKVTTEGLEQFISEFGWIRSLANDEGWVTVPCTNFWPDFSVPDAQPKK
jgi:hypothetical protein